MPIKYLNWEFNCVWYINSARFLAHVHIDRYKGKQTGATLPFFCSHREQQSTKIRLRAIYTTLKFKFRMNLQQYLYVNFTTACNSYFVFILKYFNRAVITPIQQSVQCSKLAVILTILLAFWLAPAYTGSIALIYILYKAKY